MLADRQEEAGLTVSLAPVTFGSLRSTRAQLSLRKSRHNAAVMNCVVGQRERVGARRASGIYAEL